MRKSITQEFEYGCGIACFAFVLNITYAEAVIVLGSQQASSERFWCKDFVVQLNRAGKNYHHKYIKPHLRTAIYQENTIVLLRRSSHYPYGHYLVRHGDSWMDPWINIPYCKDIAKAKSGFRKRLPGKPMYALFADNNY